MRVVVVSFFALIVTLLDKRLLFGFGGESFYGSNAMLLCLVKTNFPRLQMAKIVKKVMVLS